MGYKIVYGDELYHFGVKGMKWGVRKQPEYSGTGRRRGSGKKMSTAKKVAIGAAVVVGVGLAAYGGYKLYQSGASGDINPRILRNTKLGKKLIENHRNKLREEFRQIKAENEQSRKLNEEANKKIREINEKYAKERSERLTNLSGKAKSEVPRTTIPRTEVPRTTIPRTTIQRTEVPRTTIPRTEVPRTNIDSYTKELLERNQRLLKKYGY